VLKKWAVTQENHGLSDIDENPASIAYPPGIDVLAQGIEGGIAQLLASC
jgi:hypothetical protein